ncbi:hypothetical protein ACTFIR_003956 [Dictyostelium discoideum]
MNPENITLVVFMGYLTHLFKENHLLDFYTIYSHSSIDNGIQIKFPDYQLCDTLLSQYKLLVNNQGLLVEECILKKDEISELNEVFNFPSDFQVNVAPFDTTEGISVSSTVKNNDTYLLIVEKRIIDSLKPLLLMSSMLSSDSSNVDVELISYLAESAITLSLYAQAMLKIYGSEVLLHIKIKDTPKMFDETETERVKKIVNKKEQRSQTIIVRIELSLQALCQEIN